MSNVVDSLSNTSISGTTKRAWAGMLELLILFSISRTSAHSTLGIPKNLNPTTKPSRSIFQYPHFRHQIICLRHHFPHQLLLHHSMSPSVPMHILSDGSVNIIFSPLVENTMKLSSAPQEGNLDTGFIGHGRLK